jgi:hypothetical protein
MIGYLREKSSHVDGIGCVKLADELFCLSFSDRPKPHRRRCWLGRRHCFEDNSFNVPLPSRDREYNRRAIQVVQFPSAIAFAYLKFRVCLLQCGSIDE